MKWSDIIRSGGFSAFVSGLLVACAVESFLKGNTSSAVMQLGLFLINAIVFVMCIMSYKQRIENEVFVSSLPVALPPHIYPIPIATVQEEVVQGSPAHHEGRLLRVEGEK